MMKSILPSLVYSVSILLTIIREHLALVQVYLHLNVVCVMIVSVYCISYSYILAARVLSNLTTRELPLGTEAVAQSS